MAVVDSRRSPHHRPPASNIPNIVVVDDDMGLTNDDLQNLAPQGIIKLCSSITEGGKEKSFDGMASLVQYGKRFFVLTSKHNFMDPESLRSVNKTQLFFPEAKDSYMLQNMSLGKPPSKKDCRPLEIANQEFTAMKQESVVWKYGYDVVMFPVGMKKGITYQTTDDPFACFMRALLPGCYETPLITAKNKKKLYAKGMKVGIVVWKTKYTEGGSAIERPHCFGSEEDINIYTGEILCPTRHTIEVSYNSYHGCSGAPVLCIDKRAEYKDFFGKIIAIHAGQPSKYQNRNRNVAFKIVGRTAEKNMFKASPETGTTRKKALSN